MVLSGEKRRELSKLPTGNVADMAGARQIMDSGIKPVEKKLKDR